MSDYRHALADPKELLRQRKFYASAIDQTEGIHRVYELARRTNMPQLGAARTIAQEIASAPPTDDSARALWAYVQSRVVSKVPRKTRYDDTFWCCLLHILDAEAVPACSIGGPLHNLIYQVYDDFDPEDVTE